jgi:hypothetical protein
LSIVAAAVAGPLFAILGIVVPVIGWFIPALVDQLRASARPPPT